MSLIGLIRITKYVEENGIDATKHGELAYPEDKPRYVYDNRIKSVRMNTVM